MRNKKLLGISGKELKKLIDGALIGLSAISMVERSRSEREDEKYQRSDGWKNLRS